MNDSHFQITHIYIIALKVNLNLHVIKNQATSATHRKVIPIEQCPYFLKFSQSKNFMLAFNLYIYSEIFCAFTLWLSGKCVHVFQICMCTYCNFLWVLFSWSSANRKLHN